MVLVVVSLLLIGLVIDAGTTEFIEPSGPWIAADLMVVGGVLAMLGRFG